MWYGDFLDKYSDLIMQNKKILVIDDEFALREMIKHLFTSEGATVYTASNGREGIQSFFQIQPDVVLLDIRMPEMDGWETCKQIRLLAPTPIIMLTTLHEEHQVERGLNCGADDFVTKPFSQTILLARTRAVLRRASFNYSDMKNYTFSDNYLSVNIEDRSIYAEGEKISLTSTEFRLFTYLFQNANRVLTFDNILDNVWGIEYEGSVDYVHVYLSHLRRKIEQDSKNPKYFVNERGVGYMFQT